MKRAIENAANTIAGAPSLGRLFVNSAVIGAGFAGGRDVEKAVSRNFGTFILLSTFFLPFLNGRWVGKKHSMWSYICLPFSLMLGFMSWTFFSAFIAEMFYIFDTASRYILAQSPIFWGLSLVSAFIVTVLSLWFGIHKGHDAAEVVERGSLIETLNADFFDNHNLEDKGDGVIVDKSYDPALTLKMVDHDHKHRRATFVPINEFKHGLDAPHKAYMTVSEEGEIIDYERVRD